MLEAVQLSRITAIMLGVRNLAPAIEFYRDKLGLKLIMQEASLALLQCGNIMLGLSRGHVNLAPHVAGATEVVFGVESVWAAFKDLQASGVVFMNEPHQVTSTDWVVHFKDPDGHMLSLFGPEGVG